MTEPAATRRARGAAAYRRGHRAEWLAALWLACRGYRILSRRYRTPVGEIDLIVRRGPVLAFVEVKARDDQASAASAIGTASQARIMRAAQYYMAQSPHRKAEIIRFDAVLLSPRRWPHHITNAWSADRPGG